MAGRKKGVGGSGGDQFAAAYPNIAEWIAKEGWIEIGHDGNPSGFIRAVYGGGMAWRGKDKYPSMDAALKDLEKGIGKWMRKNW